jgi:hypothetical protein
MLRLRSHHRVKLWRTRDHIGRYLGACVGPPTIEVKAKHLTRQELQNCIAILLTYAALDCPSNDQSRDANGG